MSSVKSTEGTVPFTYEGETFHTWYKIVGDLTASRPPLIVVHGGPGESHDYLIPLADLASLHSITAIFYDQLGSGKSTHLTSKPESFWTFDLLSSQLEDLVSQLQITAFDLLGHSFGVSLVVEYIYRKQPQNLRRLILANGQASWRLRNEGRPKLLAKLPDGLGQVILKHEKDGNTAAEEYKDAMRVYELTYICRLDPYPDEIIYGIRTEQEYVSKALKRTDYTEEWSAIGKLNRIRVPTLLITGEYDFIVEEASEPFFGGISKVKWVKFTQSSHSPQWEEREKFNRTIATFLLLPNL